MDGLKTIFYIIIDSFYILRITNYSMDDKGKMRQDVSLRGTFGRKGEKSGQLKAEEEGPFRGGIVFQAEDGGE